jgi:sugar transferase EpsL
LRLTVKRGFDMAAALLGLILSAPLLIACGCAVALTMGWPIVFRQTRTGYKGRLFTMFKLRTMTDARDAKGRLLSDEQRLTWLGRFLRSTSLDELPQLINVLRGDMSIVGPRPLLPEYLPLYTAEQARRLDAKPGLTSWHAVKGRNAVSWERQFSSEVWYVDHQSFWLDMKIIVLTVVQVLRRQGITQEGHATREPFRGSVQGDAP